MEGANKWPKSGLHAKVNRLNNTTDEKSNACG